MQRWWPNERPAAADMPPPSSEPSLPSATWPYDYVLHVTLMLCSCWHQAHHCSAFFYLNGWILHGEMWGRCSDARLDGDTGHDAVAGKAKLTGQRCVCNVSWALD